MEKIRVITYIGDEKLLNYQISNSLTVGTHCFNEGCSIQIEDVSNIDLEDKKPFVFEYTNYKKEKSTRRVIPIVSKFMKMSPLEKETKWYLKAYDLDKGEIRYFDMNKIK